MYTASEDIESVETIPLEEEEEIRPSTADVIISARPKKRVKLKLPPKPPPTLPPITEQKRPSTAADKLLEARSKIKSTDKKKALRQRVVETEPRPSTAAIVLSRYNRSESQVPGKESIGSRLQVEVETDHPSGAVYTKHSNNSESLILDVGTLPKTSQPQILPDTRPPVLKRLKSFIYKI